MRTYRVVPLAPTAGMLQWVDNTQPLSSYLSPAHSRYRPHDWSNYPYEDNGNDSRGSGSVARAERRGARGGSGARDALDQELANARDVLDLIRGGAASSYAGSDDDSPR